MGSREARITIVILLAGLAAAAPPAAQAHGDAPEGPYDPLALDLHAFLTGDGALAEAAPADGARPFAPSAQPGQPNPPLDFALPAPTDLYTQRGVRVTLVVESHAAGPARDANGDSFEIALLRAGEPIEGASARATIGPLLSPGETYEVEIPLAPPATLYARGEDIGVRVRALMPLANADALALRVGADASRADFEGLRVPHVRDLGLANEGQVAFRPGEETFRPAQADATVLTAKVHHDSIAFEPRNVTAGRPLYVVFVGEEDPATAESEHERFTPAARRAAAHAFRVGGQEVLVHPGVGIAVQLSAAQPGTIDLACAANCPVGDGWTRTIRIVAPTPDADDQRSALIPPPPDRSGVPQSGTDTATTSDGKETPVPAAALALAGLVVALLVRRRR